MKLAVVVLCVAACSFLLRVLAALVKESVTSAPLPLKVYLANFHPACKRGLL